MANITQTIPNLTQGISQQPDEYKVPGQVRDLNNALPDITQGLIKRPSGQFVSSLTDGTNSDGSTRNKKSSTDGKWFHYYRDETEQYIGQIHTNGTVRMWDCLTGDEKNVVNGLSSGNNYLHFSSGNEDNLQTLTLNDFTYINNRSVEVEMDTTTEPLGDFGKECFIELKSIAYAKQYSLNLFKENNSPTTESTVTRIRIDQIGSSNNYGTTFGFFIPHSTRDNFDEYAIQDSDGPRYAATNGTAGDANDAFCPNVGTRIFEISDRSILIDHNAAGGRIFDTSSSQSPNPGKEIANETYGSGQTFTDRDGNSVSRECKGDNFKYQVQVKKADGTDNNDAKQLYFRLTCTGQSVPYTDSSGDTIYKARYTVSHDLLYGGDNWNNGDYFFFWMKDAYYKCTIEAVSTSLVQCDLAQVRPNPTPFDPETTVTASSILGDIRRGIIGSQTGSTGNGFTVTQIGNGLHVKRNEAFNASTAVGELLNVVAGQVNDVGDLPSQCKHGMVLEVVNSDADEDNHYVKFFANNNKDGEGVWEECAQPGRKIRLKRSTMPIVLIRTVDGNFRLSELDGSTYSIGGVTQPAVPQWDDALVGDDVTNKEPSFIGKTINKMVFFRNRFTILADENIIMSRPGDFTNFFNKSAIAFVDSDPIDIAASSPYPAILYDGIEVNTGLLLFSKTQQFMLTTDSDIFSVKTAKINALSTYNFNTDTNPISLGTTIGFLDNAGKHSRFFEMAQVQREGEPLVIEQSKVVDKLFEKNLKLISNSRENDIIFFSEDRKANNNTGTNVLYGYRYFDQIEERKLASWFKWTLSGNIQYHCMQDDFLYVVVTNNSKEQLLKFSLKMDANTFSIAENRVHLDHVRSTNGWTYDATNNKSTKSKNHSDFIGLESSLQLAVYDNSNNSSGDQNLGRFAEVSVVGNNYEVAGNWQGETFLIGYQYTMEVVLPTIYYTAQVGSSFRSDTRSNLILHRVKLGLGPIGTFRATLTRRGRTDYHEDFEVTPADAYTSNTAAILDESTIKTIPIYDRNTNAVLKLKSTHPAPATMLYVTWEGVLNNNFYQRV